MRKACLLTALLLLGMMTATARAEPPQLVVTIRPLHALVSMVTEGVTEPVLLLNGPASPHDYALRPRDVQRLQRADLVVMMGGGLESFMHRVQGVLPVDSPPMIIMEALQGKVLFYPMRTAGGYAEHNHAHDQGAGDRAVDPHIWLSVTHAQAIVTHVAAWLGAHDVDNALLYKQNLASALAELSMLDEELRAQLTPLKARPYLVYHDALQYMEQAYGLNNQGAVTLHPGHPISAHRVEEMRNIITKQGAACIFHEAGAPVKALELLAEHNDATVQSLDIVGISHPPGSGLYSKMMRQLADDMAYCLK